MTDLRRALADYLTIRRGLGFKLERAEKLLVQFITFLEARDTTTISVEDTVAWVRLPGSTAGRGWLALRMQAVRGFATYLHTLDPTVVVAPAGLFPDGGHRAVPYLYSDAEIRALQAAAGTLRAPLGAATYATLVGLLAVTGLRVGEGSYSPGAGELSSRGVTAVSVVCARRCMGHGRRSVAVFA